MATAEEYLAAADRAEKAGAKDDAAYLRKKAAELSAPKQPSRDEILAAADRARKAGAASDADYLEKLANQNAPQPAPVDAVPPPRGGSRTAAEILASPQQTRTQRPDTFGDTTAAMVSGPWSAAKAFGSGLVGGPSPSKAYLANDPMTKNLPDWVLTGLGGVGDTGGAALSGLGAAISGAAGLGAEMIPGLSQQTEQDVAEGALVASQFAVPELSGVSSTMLGAGRVASKAPTVTDDVARMADDVAAADRFKIPVFRTDVKPPTTFIGKVAQKTGESIPIAGMGGPRAAQNTARIEAAQNLAREYGADAAASAIDDVTASVLANRRADLTKYTGQKTAVINKLSANGSVPVPKSVAAIDQQIALLKQQRLPELDGVISRLEGFKGALQNQPLDVIERNRAALGKAFADPSLAEVSRDAGEKALSAIYGPLRDDMGTFIKDKGGSAAFTSWKSANDELAGMAGELKDATLKRVLSKGDATPEVVRRMLFSQNPSDVKRLYRSLTPEGQARARTAVIQEALSKAGGIEALSPEKFKASLNRMASQVGVFFKGDDFEAVTGLMKALKLTERAATAGVAPLTGIQNLPAITNMGLLSYFGSSFGTIGGIAATAGANATIGTLARIYESTGVRSALRIIAKANDGSAAQVKALGRVSDAFKSLAPAATNAANESAAPDYNSLYGRY